jgi:hypothetical protein
MSGKFYTGLPLLRYDCMLQLCWHLEHSLCTTSSLLSPGVDCITCQAADSLCTQVRGVGILLTLQLHLLLSLPDQHAIPSRR